MRTRAKAVGKVPPGQESPDLENQELHQSSGQKGTHWELEQDPLRERDALSLPGALTEFLTLGRVHHTAELPKGLQRMPIWDRSGSGGDSVLRELHRPRSGIPAKQAQEPRGTRDTAQDLALPPGQAEAGRTQDRKDAPAAGRLRAEPISATVLGVSRPRPLWTGSCSSYCGS